MSSTSSSITLRLLLVSGKAHDFNVDTDFTIGKIKQLVFDNWPSEWASESVAAVEVIRLVHRGKFLEDNVVFSTLPWGEESVKTMHLVPRPAGKPTSVEDSDTKLNGSSCCVIS